MWDFSAQSWEFYESNGKAGTTQLRFIHITDASLRVLLKLLDQNCRPVRQFGAWLTHGIIITISEVCDPVK